jgi:hypothetical protein
MLANYPFPVHLEDRTSMQITDTERTFAGLVRETRFGTIEHIRLSGGRPIIDANTEVATEYRLSGTEPPKEVMTDDEYLMRPQVRAMFERFRLVQDGIIKSLDIRDGLPFKMIVRRSARM